MKNYGNISSISATLVRPYKRYYNSALSIWLSVDPMADKYPSTSPYTYCANNPVRLLDPNGEAWLEKEDETKGKEMISRGMDRISRNNRFIARLENKYQRSNDDTKRNDIIAAISEVKEENALIQEGIKGIKEMASSDIYFHFNEVERGTACFVQKGTTEKNEPLINIYSDDLIETRWHESVHVSDWLTKRFPRSVHDFASDGILGNNSDEVETHAYQIEFAFSRKRFDGISLFSRNSYKEIQGEQRKVK